uniref:Uncharacterized protein n=1 Tax=Lepeophtheirus salmonis TaxID=72036 RepID=A0A0K2SVE0_LEPSM
MKRIRSFPEVATDSRGYGISAFLGSQVDYMLHSWKPDHVLPTRKQPNAVGWYPNFFRDRL